MTVLIDSSLLIGIAVDDHEHHPVTARWLRTVGDRLATCPMTQGTVVRHVVRSGQRAHQAVAFLAALADRSDHEFWPDDLSYAELPTARVVGHRQVADACLAELARRHGAGLATFDRSQASLHSDVTDLVPIS